MSTTERLAPAVLRGAASGAVLGAAWGVLARVWMRTVSTDPGFTWSGTLYVIGAFTGVGLLVGVVRALRVRGAPSAWKLLLVPGLLPFAGAGLLLLPPALFGAWALGGRGPRWAHTVVLVAALLAFPAAVWFLLTPASDRAVLDGPTVVLGLVVVEGLLAWGLSEVFRTHSPRPEASGLEPAAVPRLDVVEGSR